MSNQHIGNIQPTLDLEEHAQISGTNGKKVFVIDDADNQITKFRPDVDDVSQAAITIDFEHHELHEGDHYFIKGINQLENNQVHDYTIKTPNTAKWAHFLFNVNSSNILSINVYEGATAVAGASLATITPFNNNRNSSNTSALTFWSLPSITATGTLMEQHKWGSRSAGELSRNNEVILKQNTTYLWRFTSGANSNVIDFDVNWYEHTSVA